MGRRTMHSTSANAKESSRRDSFSEQSHRSREVCRVYVITHSLILTDSHEPSAAQGEQRLRHEEAIQARLAAELAESEALAAKAAQAAQERRARECWEQAITARAATERAEKEAEEAALVSYELVHVSSEPEVDQAVNVELQQMLAGVLAGVGAHSRSAFTPAPPADECSLDLFPLLPGGHWLCVRVEEVPVSSRKCGSGDGGWTHCCCDWGRHLPAKTVRVFIRPHAFPLLRSCAPSSLTTSLFHWQGPAIQHRHNSRKTE